jgi:SAM-dependent methyltransferase
MRAAYDEIADWYADYVVNAAAGFTARVTATLREALGQGSGVCWDAACGTGAFAGTLRELGWRPVGTDVSRGQLQHAASHEPVALADATRPPLRPGSVAAVASVMCHTDLDDYPGLCRAAAVLLAPGGRFAHVGVHPCFVGAFADRADPDRAVITPGYWRRERSFASWNSHGVRARVGAVHLPLADLLAAVLDAGLVLDAVLESGEPTPDILAISAHRPAAARAGGPAGPGPAVPVGRR